MSTQEPDVDDILRPIQNTSKWYFIALAIALGGAGLWVLAYSWQLMNGLAVTGLSDWGSGGGSTWGLYIGMFIWWVGIAHGGIILSAAVRLFGMDRYQPVARLAELLTIAALSMAGSMILVHTGRPDRLVWSVILAYPATVFSSPLIWDVTVITLYFVLTATYLALTLRYDVSRLRDDLPDMFEPLYRVITLGYDESEDEIVERMVWWLAGAIIVLAPLLLHGGVIPWLFALMPSMPSWFGGIQGPSFLSIALSSAIAGVIILSYAFRARYDWHHLLTDAMMRGLTKWLGLFVLLFLWLQLQQRLTGLFAAPVSLLHFTQEELANPVYILAIVAAVLALAFILSSSVRPRLWTPLRAVVASFVVLAATLTEKALFVTGGIQHAGFELYAAVPGEYTPSLIELAGLLGTVSLVVVFFLVVSKLFPVVELHAVQDDHDEEVSA